MLEHITWMLYGAVVGVTLVPFVKALCRVSSVASSEVTAESKDSKPIRRMAKTVSNKKPSVALAIQSNFNTWLAITVLVPIIFMLLKGYPDMSYLSPIIMVLYIAISALSVRDALIHLGMVRSSLHPTKR